MNENEMTIKLKAVEVYEMNCKGCFFVDTSMVSCPTIKCAPYDRKDGKNIIWVEDK